MTPEITNQILEMLKAGSTYSQIQNKLGVYAPQIRRIRRKYFGTNTKNSNTNIGTNTKNNNTNVSTNTKNNNTNVSVNAEIQLKQQHKIDLDNLKQQHKIDLDNLKQQHEIDLENLKNQLKQQHKIDLDNLKQQHEIELENFAIKLKNETELKKMQDELEQFKKETEPDEPEEENGLPEPRVNDIVVWKNKNIEGYISGIKDNIAKVKFGHNEVFEIPFSFLTDNGAEWLFDYDFENADKQRKISRNSFFRRH